MVQTGSPENLEIENFDVQYNRQWRITLVEEKHTQNMCVMGFTDVADGFTYKCEVQWRWKLVAAYFELPSLKENVGYITGVEKNIVIYDWWFVFLEKQKNKQKKKK